MSQLFPDKDVIIQSQCIQSGEPIRVRMRGLALVDVTPDTAVGHSNQTMDQWGSPSWAFT